MCFRTLRIGRDLVNPPEIMRTNSNVGRDTVEKLFEVKDFERKVPEGMSCVYRGWVSLFVYMKG